MDTRLCPECGSQLGALKPARAIYCSNSCKVAAFRSNRMEQAKRVLTLLREPPTPPSVRALAAAASSEDPIGNGWKARLAYVARNEPTIVDSFGMAVLTASVRPASAGTCRWCIASNDSRVHKLKPPAYDSATRLLLGTPCQMDLAFIRSQMDVRVNAGRRKTPRSGTSVPRRAAGSSRAAASSLVRSLAASGEQHDEGTWHYGSCVVCQTFTVVGRDAPEGARPPSPPPHVRMHP